jgi:large subunit ribosomal protein L25
MKATLRSRIREGRGKGPARQLRREGRIPAVLYGHGDLDRSLSLDAVEVDRLVSSVSVETTLIDLQIEGAETVRTLIRDVQWHPFKPLVLHIDFQQVHAGEKLHLKVPVRIHGTPTGVRDEGGVLQQVLHEIEAECLPADIPEAADLEVGELSIGDALYVRDLNLPGVTVITDGDLVVCSVVAPTVADLPETTATEEGVAGEMEPELVRDRTQEAEDVPFERGSAQPE